MFRSGLKNHVRWCIRAQWTLGGMILVLMAGFYVLGYRPQNSRLSDLRAQILRRQYELRESQSRTRILPAIANDVKALREQLDQSKKLPPQQELPQFLKDVATLGQGSALHKFVIKPGMPSRGELFSELPISLSFDGEFIDVFNFLRHTEEMQRLTRVRSMSIKSKDGKLGQVQVQLSMNIYFAAD